MFSFVFLLAPVNSLKDHWHNFETNTPAIQRSLSLKCNIMKSLNLVALGVLRSDSKEVKKVYYRKSMGNSIISMVHQIQNLDQEVTYVRKYIQFQTQFCIMDTMLILEHLYR